MPREEEIECPNEGASHAPASFDGRLKLTDFAYSEPTSNRRSPRLAANPRYHHLYESASSLPKQRSSSSPSSTSAFPTASAATTSAPAPPGNNNQTQTQSSNSSRNSNSNSSSQKNKRKREPAGYAPPSKYAHLPLLPDAIGPDLLVLFVGLNPGIQTARTGHAYAHPSNLFWKLLYSSGVTPRPCRPEEDAQMPALYQLGLTNIVGRPSRNGAELSMAEMDDGVAALEDKARRWRPESMCVVGKSIWESVWRVRHGGKKVGENFRYGWQEETENMGRIEGEWSGARMFVASSTSGLAASLSKAEKQAIWDQLGSWVKERRVERAAEKDGGGESMRGGERGQ